MRNSLHNRHRVAGTITFLLVLGWVAVAWHSPSTLTSLPQLSPIQKIDSPVFAASCDYDDNLDELAQSFIGRCCVGSINREFPGEYYSVSLRTIKSDKNNSVGNAIKAYKLLNDNRFRK